MCTGKSDNYDFLSPARRGRGILVTPGFCPASHFFVGAKTQKLLIMTFLATWGWASDFLKMLQIFEIAARGHLQIFFVGTKTPKLNLKLFKFYYPRYADMQV